MLKCCHRTAGKDSITKTSDIAKRLEHPDPMVFDSAAYGLLFPV